MAINQNIEAASAGIQIGNSAQYSAAEISSHPLRLGKSIDERPCPIGTKDAAGMI